MNFLIEKFFFINTIKNETTKFEISISAIVQFQSDKTGKFVISKNGDYNVAKQYSLTLNNEKKFIQMLSESIAENIIEELIQRANDT